MKTTNRKKTPRLVMLDYQREVAAERFWDKHPEMASPPPEWEKGVRYQPGDRVRVLQAWSGRWFAWTCRTSHRGKRPGSRSCWKAGAWDRLTVEEVRVA